MINVYIDTSGSMTEMGKDRGADYVAKSVVDYCSALGIEAEVNKLDGYKIKDLGNFFDSAVENSIFLSDGLFRYDKEKIFDIAISVGIDSDRKVLEKVAAKTFQSDDLVKALEYLIFYNDLFLASERIMTDDEW